ncbi:MAG: response regulator [Planctomycetota bacterium]|nr:MAG: response regulator [Planctomycetota bacterium]
MAWRMLDAVMSTILVIDDDRLVRESVCELLDELGCASIPVCDGHQALSHFQGQWCDLIVSDVDMPDISGFEFLARLQRQCAPRQHPPLIFLSARADDMLRHAAQAAGAAQLFAKPLPVGDFSRTVRALLPRHS